MAALSAEDNRIEVAASGESPRRWWRSVAHSWEGRIGLAMGAVILLVVLVGPHIAPYSPTENGVGPIGAGPSGSHWLGTDDLGRDVTSRVLAGGTLVLVIPLVANLFATLIGGGVAIWAVYIGGKSDKTVTGFFDVMLTLPPLLMVLVIIAGLGTSTAVLTGAITLFFIPRAGRVLRGAAQAVVANDYIAAAQARGEGSWWLVRREILPNIAGPALADFALRTTYAIIFVATLSFLGLGVQPPAPDWGAMVAQNRDLITTNPAAILGPIAAIVLLAVSLNLLADALSRHVSGAEDDEGVTL